MFAKLLKHEWRATRGVVGLLCAIILIAGLTIGGVMHYMVRVDNGENLIVEEASIYVEPEMSVMAEVVCFMLIFAGVMAIAICCAGAVFLLLSRFYKRCFTDEGYLTFTLPVNSNQILLSSIVNTVAGMALVILAAVLSMMVIFGLFLAAVPQTIIWADVLQSTRDVLGQLGESLAENWQEILMTAVSAAVGAFSTLIQLMLSITIGALVAKKHKIITAAAVYYGINLAISLVQVFLASTNVFSQDLNWLLGSTLVLSAVTAAGGYFLTHWLVSKKLNLT